VVQLGALDDFDDTFWNGTRIGGHGKETPAAYALRRRYVVPAALTDCAEAVIATRIFDNYGNGGFAGPASAMALQVSDAGIPVGPRVSLAGKWRFQVERAIPLPVREGVEGQAVPSALYNAMVHPFVRFPVRGFLWYQGESDVSRAHQYRTILTTLVNSWRERWGLGDLPFLIVQIAPFGAASEAGDESRQAELREAQAQVAQLPNAALASTVDCGDAFDIHPVDKRTVGVRLALAAKRVAYNQDVVHSGPVLAGASREGRLGRLRFRHADGGLRVRDGRRIVRGFAVGGADGSWREAAADVDGECVLVGHPDIVHPVEVRYGWSDVPLVELENAARLPAVPFRVQIP
jgi:sialate O-acetylesterase